jgi:hypothetical protein
MTCRAVQKLVVRARVKFVSGAAGQAVAAAQGRALGSLLAVLNTTGPADRVDGELADHAAAHTEELC